MNAENILQNLVRTAYLRVFRLLAYGYPVFLIYYISFIAAPDRLAFLAVRLPLAFLLIQIYRSPKTSLASLRLVAVSSLALMMVSNALSLDAGVPRLLDAIAHVSFLVIGFLELRQAWALILNSLIALCWLLCEHFLAVGEPAQIPLLLTLGLSHYLLWIRRRDLGRLADMLVEQSYLNVRRQQAVQLVMDCNALLDRRVEMRRQELQQAELRLRQVYEDLQATQVEQRELQSRLSQGQRLAALARFAQGLSHSFSNTVTCIWSSLPELKRMETECLDDLSKACQQASQICHRLNLSCGATAQGELTFEVNPLVARNLDLLRRAVSNPIEFHPCPESCVVSGDPALLDQVIWNLVLNAAQASLPTDPIIVTITNEPKSTVITICDHGSGISPALQERVFEPFFSVDSSRGHGLGLAIVKAAVESLHGDLEMSSQPDEGTTFQIRLNQAEQPVPAAQPQPPETAVTAPSQGSRICLVEDQEALRRLLTNYLRQQKHYIHPAASAEEMVELPTSFDLLITDVSLPGRNGVQLAQQMAAENPRLKVLFMSGYPFEASAVNNDNFRWLFLPKPFRLNELSEYIAKLESL